MRRRPLQLTLALVAALAVVAGCASDGRELAEPEDWQTTTTRPLPATSALPSETGTGGLALSSPDFEAGAAAPDDVSCRGRNVFPALRWEGVPAGAAELAITLSDQTDPEEPLLLWLTAGIPPTVTSLDSGVIPAGSFETLNDYGNPGYGSPCLNTFSSGTRDLQFRLYALAGPSGLAPGDPGNTAWSTLSATAIESASLLMRIDSDTP